MKNSQPSLLSSLRALPRPAWVLFFGVFLNKFGAFVIPFLTLYLTGRGYTLGDAGMAIGAYGAGNLAASLLGGYLADRIGRRKTIVLSMFSGALAMMLLSTACSLPAIIALTALTGLTSEMYRPASSALLADLVPPELRVTAYSAYRMAFNAGWAFGPATAGLLAGRGYFWLFAGDATTSALFGLVAFFALPHWVRSESNDSGWGEALRDIGRNRQFHRLLLSTIAIALVFFQMFSTFGLHVIHLGFSARVYGLILSMNGALVVCCELPLTTITRRFPARKTMAVGYVLGGLGFGLTAFAHSIPALAACVVILTFGEMVAMPVSVAYVADLAPAHMRGRYMGMYSLVWAMALTIGPAIGLRLFSFGTSALWLVCGILGLLAALVITGGGKTPPEPDSV
jgi:MFS family permease